MPRRLNPTLLQGLRFFHGSTLDRPDLLIVGIREHPIRGRSHNLTGQAIRAEITPDNIQRVIHTYYPELAKYIYFQSREFKFPVEPKGHEWRCTIDIMPINIDRLAAQLRILGFSGNLCYDHLLKEWFWSDRLDHASVRL